MNRKYRHAIIAGNWKMHMLSKETRDFAAAFRELVPEHKWCDAMIFVPFTLLETATRALKRTRVAIGAQTVSEHKHGAYTGEVSVAQVKDAGATCVIIGHSERRTLFGITDAITHKKLRTSLDGGLRPILCVGESYVQRDMGVTHEIVALQLKSALHEVTPQEARRVIIAYEPVWAIGTGRAATPEIAQEACREIRAVLRSLYGARVARAVPVLYGGSVTDDNAAPFFAMPDIDGALVGGASLDARKFAGIINAAKDASERDSI